TATFSHRGRTAYAGAVTSSHRSRTVYADAATSRRDVIFFSGMGVSPPAAVECGSEFQPDGLRRAAAFLEP
ncbi:MAG: hypothetical protein ACKPEY_09985, partial [Planctomycetota bacterium]